MEALQRKQEREMARELMEQKKEITEARNEQVHKMQCHGIKINIYQVLSLNFLLLFGMKL